VQGSVIHERDFVETVRRELLRHGVRNRGPGVTYGGFGNRY
jgi:hypothetical protein